MDLMDLIFTQLMGTKSTRMRGIIEDWHLSYHSEERSFTPMTLIDAAEKKCKALHQGSQLYTTVDSEILALEATVCSGTITLASAFQAFLQQHGYNNGKSSQHNRNSNSNHSNNMGQNLIGTTWHQQTPPRLMNLTIESGIGAQSAALMESGYVPTNPSSI
jgi:hypothetical protein